MEEKMFVQLCNDMRAECKALEGRVRAIKNTEAVTGPCCLRQMTPEEMEEARRNPKTEPNRPEMAANLMIAVRHLEDARMRLGKAIQYSGDGVSIYDK